MDYFKGKVILLIEDDAGYRELLQSELAGVNAIVFSTSRGKQATDAFQHHHKVIDCILLGTELPLGVSGFEVYDVHADRLHRKGVIFMTSDSDRESRPLCAPLVSPQRVPPEPLDVLLASEVYGSETPRKKALPDRPFENDLTSKLKHG